jgi:hypothetical protein
MAEITLEELQTALVRRFDNIDAKLREHDERFDRVTDRLNALAQILAGQQQALAGMQQG